MADILGPLGYNIIIAILGGIVVAAGGFIKRRLHNIYLQRKYPISGDYLSIYQDEIDGHQIRVKAPVRIKQQGRKIHATTSNAEGQRWVLSGEISKTGYMYGFYHAESFQDRGLGTFFLEIRHDGNLEGVWSGYDATNDAVESGTYSFVRKKMISLLAADDNKYLPLIMDISQIQLGEAYLDETKIVGNDNITFVALVDGTVAGFCISKVINAESFISRTQEFTRIKQLNLVHSIGLLDSMATQPGFEGIGVGSALMTRALSALAAKGVTLTVMTGWKSGERANIESLALRNGFKSVMEVENYWREDSVSKGYSCPHCGKPPCTCSAVVYLKHMV